MPGFTRDSLSIQRWRMCLLNVDKARSFGKTACSELSAHSWFATVVDGNELGPVYPFQLNKLKYEDP